MIVPISNELHPHLVRIALQDIGSMYQSAIHDELEDVTSGKSFGVCAIENGLPVGYAIAKRTVDSYHLLTIAVDQHHRGKGLGSLLLDSIFAEIKQQGGKILNVVTDADANESLQFYLKNGFVLTGIVQDEFISGVAQVHLTRRMGYRP
ncbi:ribosomal protein S18 acetylase RimI-like enzyme [Nitrosomonas nitrosa]|jgi:ribosomal-protein-alanine N-acetyltransferase|uniref:GNAT family N-acetyltransferase n=1 Tax=Nitrosomonas TaxID=914 RepID=UPI000D3171F0|nr:MULTISPECIES: GNAT family N-acetyltransferase [Nitrosomonas]MCW5598084.1 GNAT family N-acetyltransferase [Nitrosomonas sp.]MCW5602421.1 GNAT family N-acetyltransferase [Nitrosomonas sp.]PTR02112.1 ribosomal protein S18 acetylase RimI-like enzyme [Nitrosomonas nitrosa]